MLTKRACIHNLIIMSKSKKAKILLVDDSPEVLKHEKYLLEKAGVDVITAPNGPEAIKKIHLEKPDLVFLDLMMPGLTGDAVCRIIRNDPNLADVAVIIVTARTDDATMQSCFRCGCDAYVTKPFTPEELLSKLKVILDEKEIYLDWDKLLGK